jgi:hypothetical protein
LRRRGAEATRAAGAGGCGRPWRGNPRRETVSAGDGAMKDERKKRTRKKEKVGCRAHKQFLLAAPPLGPLTGCVKEAPV